MAEQARWGDDDELDDFLEAIASSASDRLWRAADQMRRNARPGDDEDRFYNAVADWLEHIAKFVDNRPADVGPATAERVWANAYHVANAYLGEA